jgi:hypothetical protein
MYCSPLQPPLAVLVLMVGFRWGGNKAGLVGWIVALVIAAARFGAGGKVLAFAHVRSLVLTFDVVYIVWAALLLYMVVDQAGALKVIAHWFTNLTSDELLRVLLLGWVFTSFLQGVGGFGVPVAIVAPLLVAWAIAASSYRHSIHRSCLGCDIWLAWLVVHCFAWRDRTACRHARSGRRFCWDSRLWDVGCWWRWPMPDGKG